MDADAVEAWIKKKPRPKILRLVTGDATREIKLHPGQTWRPIVDSLLDMDPDRIEALDSDGGLLRAVSAENETVASPPAQAGTKRPVQLTATAVADPESQRFILFAQLLSEAYRHANDVAFARMVDLFEAVNERHETTERLIEQLHKLLQKAAAQAMEGETPSDPLETLFKAFTGGMEAGAANGKAEA
jgi:hypothetical protein